MSERKITIQEEAPGSGPKPKAVESNVDFQDACLILGFIGLIGGTCAISWRVGTILAGVFFLAAAYLIERAKRINGSHKP